MLYLCRLFLALVTDLFRPRAGDESEILLLGQQIIVLRRARPGRVPLLAVDRMALAGVCQLFPKTHEVAWPTFCTGRVERLGASIFGAPRVLTEEDPQAYADLLANISRALTPGDTLEEIWIRDAANLTWEIFRLRKLKTMLIEKGRF